MKKVELSSSLEDYSDEESETDTLPLSEKPFFLALFPLSLLPKSESFSRSSYSSKSKEFFRYLIPANGFKLAPFEGLSLLYYDLRCSANLATLALSSIEAIPLVFS